MRDKNYTFSKRIKHYYGFWVMLNILIFVTLSIGVAETVSAEGTKTASPGSSNCTALGLLPSRANGAYLGCLESNRIYFRITDFNTERLYYGFNWQKYGGGTINNMYMKIFAPNGTVATDGIRLPDSGYGFINSYDQAVIGPAIGQNNTFGYLPLCFIPKANGEYWVEFYRSNDRGKTQAPGSVWSYSPYFDFTVATAEGEVHNGRVHCGKWGFVAIEPSTFANNPLASASPILYPLTDDGVVYKVSFQEGFEPIDFNVAMTRYGITNTKNWLYDRRSRKDITSPPLIDGYPIFLSPPDSTVYQYATLPPMPTFANPPILGCHPGPYKLRFNLSQAGDCRILLDINGEDGYQTGTSDRMINLPGCSKGLNTYIWDGKDGLGNIVPAETNVLVSLIYNKGRGNLPIFDAEINKGGFNIACIAPIQVEHLRIYWDDSNLKNIGTNLKNDLNNITGAGLDNSIVGTVTPAHAWNGDGNLQQQIPAPAVKGNDLDTYQANDFGNVRTINSWFWGVELTAYSATKATCVSISGKVHTTQGSKTAININGLNVILVDPATNVVLSSTTVNKNGTYTLTNCPVHGQNMIVQLSTMPGAEGSQPPKPSAPANWVNTFPLTQSVTTETVSLTGIDFGIAPATDRKLLDNDNSLENQSFGSTGLQGFVKDKRTLNPIGGATVFFWDKKDKKVYIAKTDGNGRYVFHVQTPCSGIIKATEQHSTSDCLSLPISSRTKQSAQTQSAPHDLLLDKFYIGKTWKIRDIYYSFDKWDIRPDARPVLDSIIDMMNTYPINLELGSHTDSRGSFSYNDHLSQRRAQAAVDYLVRNGISPTRITAKGYGERHLVNRCADEVPCSEAEHQANRRTEIKVIGYLEEQEMIPSQFDPSQYRNGEQIDLKSLPSNFFAPCGN
jgi:outer membrane protein OmpA-like peptidoglycan-associated protein